ncbi:MAG TPA: anti-sigma factor [Acidimicrobiales bacterium]|nr:anti-sigma factor [Acidimicrobiales bacterium]
MNEDEFAELLGSGTPRSNRGHADGGRSGARDPSEDVRALLGDANVWAEPSAGGADALVAAIRSEMAAAAVAPEPEAEPSPADRGGAGAPANGVGVDSGVPGMVTDIRRDGRARPPRPSHLSRAPGRRARRPYQWIAAGTAAAAALVLAGVAGAVITDDHGGPPGTEFAIAGTDLAPGASAIATVDELSAGVGIMLDVRGLPPAAPGTYYEAWVKGPAGVVSVGTFHMRGGDDGVYLWAGVETERYPTLSITLENEDGNAASSGQVVLTGPVSTADQPGA